MYRKSRDRRQERQKGTPKRRTTREEPAWSDWVALTRDESDQRGIRVVLELKRGVDGATVAEALYQHGRLEQRLGAQCLALVDGVPEQLPLRRALEVFIAHRLDVIQRRSVALRERAANRRHIVQGLLQAQLNLDKVVRWVREAESPAEARATLIAKLRVDTTQADAILALRLSQLTKLDRHALDAEEAELTATVAQLDSLLGSATQQRAAVRDELAVAVKAFGRTRRTRIATEDVAPVLAVNAATLYLVPDGSMETTPARGGVPVAVSPSHPLWGWTAEGTYAMATPEGWPTAPGAPVIGTWIGPWPADGSLVGIFANGMLKRVACADLVPRGEWAPWITRQPEDRLVAAVVVRPGEDVVVATTDGQGLRVAVADIPAYGLKARGVVGMRLRGAAQVCDGGRLEATEHVVVRTSTGGVLAFEGTEWPRQGRGGIGVRLVQLRADETLEAVATGPLSALWAASTGRGPAKWHSVPSEAETVRRRGATARPGPTGPRQRPGRHQAGS
jgi:DNA gyrase subunit A